MTGRARLFGDDINTDYIVASRRKRETIDPLLLRRYLFEEIDPQFAASVAPGDLIVAGRNFGCGSAMEVAVTAVLGAGIRAVIARSFSRTYFRNAVNNGLLPVVCNTGGIREGDPIEILRQPRLAVRNCRSAEILPADPLPEIMWSIVDAGGLVPYFRKHGDFI